MKVAVYYRVQEKDQKDLLIEYAEKNNLIYDIYLEDNDRHIKSILLNKLKNNEYDGLLIYNFRSWADSSTELILEMDEFINKKINFISLCEGIDFSNQEMLEATSKIVMILKGFKTKEDFNEVIKENKFGRKRGSKDKNPRSKIGYFIRAALRKNELDQSSEDFKKLLFCIDNIHNFNKDHIQQSREEYIQYRRRMPSKKMIFNYWINRLEEFNKPSEIIEVYKKEQCDFCFACGWETVTKRCHILPYIYGGKNESDNIHLLCGKCHSESENLHGETYWDWFKIKDYDKWFNFWLDEKNILAKKSIERLKKTDNLPIESNTLF